MATLILAVLTIHPLPKKKHKLLVLFAQTLHFFLHLLHLLSLSFPAIPRNLAISLQSVLLLVLFCEC